MIYSTKVAKYTAQDEKTGLKLDKVGNQKLVSLIGAQLGEVEEVDDYAAKLEGVIVAKIVSCEKHPDADKLSVCLIDDGGRVDKVERNSENLVQVVCGAPNAKAGLIVAWIPPGNIVPSTFGTDDEFKLEARKLRGMVSSGMLASGQELGVSDDHGGILEIDIDPNSEADKLLEPGTSFVKLYGLDDYLINIENKMFTHRPDLFGNLGISREVAGILGQKFSSPSWYKEPVEIDYVKSDMNIKLNNEAKDLVPRFTVGLVDKVHVEPSPIWMQALLGRWGTKSLNNVVDYTNYYSMLTAQPTHAFDYDKLAALSSGDGVSLGVRLAKKGEKLTILGGKELTLTENDIVIATDKKAVALAGVMGGAETEVDENTKRIVIECATFDMYSIRRTSMRHGLFTDAVTRYSKGQSPHQNEQVLKKMMLQMQEASGFKPVLFKEDSTKPTDNKSVKVSTEFVNSRLGSSLTTDQMSTMLHNVEFEVSQSKEELTLKAPFWRTDIEILEDVVEEIGRLYGYDNLPASLPRRTSKPTELDSLMSAKTNIRNILSNAGANELLTYSFVDRKLLEKAQQDPKNSYGMTNALSPELEFYRQSSVPSLLDKVYSNMRNGFDEFAVYEIAKVHNKKHIQEDGVPGEIETTGFVYVNKDNDSPTAYYKAKYCLNYLLESSGIKPEFKAFDEDPGYDVIKPFDLKRSAMIMINGDVMGIVGEFKPEVESAFKLPRQSAGFELFTGALVSRKSNSGYRAVSDFPKSSQDITLQVDSLFRAGDLQKVVEGVLESEDLLSRLQLTSIFAKEGGSTKNITFSIDVSSYAKTLTTEEVNQMVAKIVKSCQDECGARQV